MNWADWEYGADNDDENLIEPKIEADAKFSDLLNVWNESTGNVLHTRVDLYPDQTSIKIKKDILLKNSVSNDELWMLDQKINEDFSDSEEVRRNLLSFDKWYAKNLIGKKEDFNNELHHLRMVVDLARFLSSECTILDVDGIHSDMFPSASDLTLLREDGVLVMIDITSQEALDAKLAVLANQASTLNFEGGLLAVCLQFNRTHNINLLKSDASQLLWDEGAEKVTDQLRDVILNSDSSELELLRDQLKAIMAPCLMKILPNEAQNYNDLDRLKNATEVVYRKMIEHFHINPDEDPKTKKEKLRRVIGGWDLDLIKEYESFMRILKKEENLDVEVKKFLIDDFDKLSCLKILRGLQMKPPVSLGTLKGDTKMIDHSVDYMFWVCRTANELYSSEEDPLKETLMFTKDGVMDVVDSLQSYRLPWNYAQAQRTRFPVDVVAYTKPITYEVTLFKRLIKGIESVLNEKDFSSHLLSFGALEEQTLEKEKWTMHVETKVAKHFQLLFNPKYCDDDNFMKFLSRHDKLPGDSPFKSFEPLSEKMCGSYDAVNSFISNSIYSIHNLAAQKLNSNSTVNKMLKMAKYKISPNMIHCVQDDSTKLRSSVFDYIDALGVHAKAFTAHIGIKHPANCVVFLNTGSFTSWSLWYLPGTFPHFNSTWRKLYSVSEMEETELFEPCNMKGLLGIKKSYTFSKRLPKEVYARLKNPLDRTNSRVDKFFKNEESKSWSLNFSCSKFKSIDKNNLEWELELMPKVLLRSHSLMELRHKLYNTINDGQSDELLGEKEVALGALLMCINSQQHSVQSTAYRYLHQALNSRDFDPYQIVNKILETRCKSHLEVYYVSKMLCVYKVALLMRLHDGIDVIRSENKEVCVVAPDFLIASSSPVLNKASYNKPNSFNKDKQYRVSSEADCVKALWDQVNDLRYVKTNDFEAYIGMPLKLYKRLMTAAPSDIYELIDILTDHAESMRSYTDRILFYDKIIPLSSNYWFEFWSLLQIRLDFQTVSTKEILSGRPINELLTIKGSTTSLKLGDLGGNVAKRKVTAVCVMLQRLENENPEVDDANLIVESVNEGRNFDMLTLSRKILNSSYLRESDMICQFSEKDAPGKSREISTLNIEFGVLSLMNEIVASKFSEQIPEDLITHSSKEEVIYRNVTNFEKEITAKDTSEVIYVNQDKSRFGPNRKNSSMLLTGLMISKDAETYANFSYALYKSSKRKVSYPHEILRQALDIRKIDIENLNNQLSRVKQAHRTGEQNIFEHGFTSSVMNEILRQYYYGNAYGDIGTFYAEPVEGMAGQGIGGIISSIQHAALSRLASEFIQETLKWRWKTFVTSDDSLTCVVYPKADSMKVHNGIKNFISRFNYSGGLIENLGKFTASSQGNEMNGFFILNGEPIVSVWKFGIAYSSLQTSGNIGEDLLGCVSKCNDLYRRGGSYYLCCILGLTLMSFVLDAYRLWSSFSTGVDEPNKDLIWEMPPEVLGIPVIDPVTAIISPIGTRISSIRSNSFDIFESTNYIRFLLESSLTSSRYDQTRKEYENEYSEAHEHVHTVETLEGLRLGLNARLPPTVNGLIGALNRRNYDTRLAMEIGGIIKDHHGKPTSSKFALKSILCSLTEALQVPVKFGTSSRSVFDQFKDVAHSPNHAYMKVSDNSFFPKHMKGRKISLNDLRNFMRDAKSLQEMRERFLETIKVANSFTPAVGKLLQFLVKESNKCKIVSDYMWSCNLSANRSDFDYDESKREKSRFKNTRRRLLALYPDAASDEILCVNFDEIKAELFCRYSKKADDLDKSLRYLISDTYGDMEEDEALLQSENTVSRLKALMPTRQLLYTESPAGVHDRSHDLINWLRMNAKDGHVFSTTYKISEFAMNLSNQNVARSEPKDTEDKFAHEIYGSMFLSPPDAPEPSKYGLSYNPLTDVAIRIPKENIFKNDGVISLEAEQMLISGRCKLKLGWSLYVSKFSKLPTSTWYGNAHYRVKFKGIRSHMGGSESSYLTGYTIKRSSSKQYTHLIVVFCNNKLLSMKNGSKSLKALEDFKADLKFSNSDTEFDRYKVLFLDKNNIFRYIMLGARTFLSLDDSGEEHHIPTVETWKLEEADEEGLSFLMNIKEFQEAHIARVSRRWEPNRTRDIKPLSSLKLPVVNWSKGHEKDFDDFILSLEKIDEKKLHETPTRFRLALLDVFSSFLVDGDVEGLKLSNSRFANNDSIHEAPGCEGKISAADELCEWVLSSKISMHNNYIRLYSLWKRFSKYYKEVFAPRIDEAEIVEWNPNRYGLGDEESANTISFTRYVGSAAGYEIGSGLKLTQLTKEENVTKFDKLERYLLDMIGEEQQESDKDFEEGLDELKARLDEENAEDDEEIVIPPNFMELMAQMTKQLEQDEDAEIL